MRKRRNCIRIISAAMAISLVMTNLSSTIAYAQEGYSEMNSRPNPALADTWRDYTFSHWADELAGIYGACVKFNQYAQTGKKFHDRGTKLVWEMVVVKLQGKSG